MDISLKLHLPELSKSETNKSVMEHMTNALVRDASLRIRREPEVIVTGLAERPRTTPLPPLSTFSNDEESESFEKLSLIEERDMQTNTRLRIKAAAIANNLTSTQVPETRKYRPMTLVKQTAKPSSENWIPEPIRFRSLHRELMTMQENLRSTLSFERDNSREIRRFHTTDLQRTLLQEELQMKKKVKCGCCLQIFSDCNLPMKVPIKAILDIRKKWTSDKPSTGGEWWRKDDERLSAIPRCYEAVLICTFCAQFFDIQEEYRPSFDKIRREVKRKQYLEAKRLEKQYWDPLKTGEMEMERLYQAELQKTAQSMGTGYGDDESIGGGLSTDGGPESTTNGLVTIQYE